MNDGGDMHMPSCHSASRIAARSLLFATGTPYDVQQPLALAMSKSIANFETMGEDEMFGRAVAHPAPGSIKF